MAMDQILFPPVITAFTFLCLTVVEGLLSGISWTTNGGLKSSGITPPGISTLYFSLAASPGIVEKRWWSSFPCLLDRPS